MCTNEIHVNGFHKRTQKDPNKDAGGPKNEALHWKDEEDCTKSKELNTQEIGPVTSPVYIVAKHVEVGHHIFQVTAARALAMPKGTHPWRKKPKTTLTVEG